MEVYIYLNDNIHQQVVQPKSKLIINQNSYQSRIIRGTYLFVQMFDAREVSLIKTPNRACIIKKFSIVISTYINVNMSKSNTLLNLIVFTGKGNVILEFDIYFPLCLTYCVRILFVMQTYSLLYHGWILAISL